MMRSKMAAMVWPCGGHNDVVATVAIIYRPLGHTAREGNYENEIAQTIFCPGSQILKHVDMLAVGVSCKCKVYIV
jgi:hypothetical protein